MSSPFLLQDQTADNSLLMTLVESSLQQYHSDYAKLLNDPHCWMVRRAFQRNSSAVLAGQTPTRQKAIGNYDSLTNCIRRRSLLRYWLQQWKAQISQQLRLAYIVKRCQANNRHHSLSKSLKTWWREFDNAQIVLNIRKRKNHIFLRRRFNQWNRWRMQSRALILANQQLSSYRLRQCFRQFVRGIQVNVLRAREDERERVCVRLFRTVRLLRAWKTLSQLEIERHIARGREIQLCMNKKRKKTAWEAMLLTSTSMRIEHLHMEDLIRTSRLHKILFGAFDHWKLSAKAQISQFRLRTLSKHLLRWQTIALGHIKSRARARQLSQLTNIKSTSMYELCETLSWLSSMRRAMKYWKRRCFYGNQRCYNDRMAYFSVLLQGWKQFSACIAKSRMETAKRNLPLHSLKLLTTYWKGRTFRKIQSNAFCHWRGLWKEVQSIKFAIDQEQACELNRLRISFQRERESHEKQLEFELLAIQQQICQEQANLECIRNNFSRWSSATRFSKRLRHRHFLVRQLVVRASMRRVFRLISNSAAKNYYNRVQLIIQQITSCERSILIK
jgi:hypothetical protein